MKKVIKIFLLIPIILIGCSSSVDFSSSDLERHPDISFFVQNESDYKGYHYLDRAIIEITFSTELSAKEYFHTVDSLANQNGWNKAFAISNYRVYIKNSVSESLDTIPAIAKIHFFNESRVVALDIR